MACDRPYEFKRLITILRTTHFDLNAGHISIDKIADKFIFQDRKTDNLLSDSKTVCGHGHCFFYIGDTKNARGWKLFSYCGHRPEIADTDEDKWGEGKLGFVNYNFKMIYAGFI